MQYFTLKKYIYYSNSRPAKTTLFPAKLHAVLACAGHLFCEYLREKDFLRETILTCLSRAQMGLIHEIKNAKKFHDTATFRAHNLNNLGILGSTGIHIRTYCTVQCTYVRE